MFYSCTAVKCGWWHDNVRHNDTTFASKGLFDNIVDVIFMSLHAF